LVSNAVTYLLGKQVDGQEHVRSAAASDIRPRPLPTFATSAPVTNTATAQPAAEWWPWLAGAALLVLGAEWLAFSRR
jgi:hypothetical protein